MSMKQKGEEGRFKAYLEQCSDEHGAWYVGTFLQRAAERFGSKTALICGDLSIDYHTLYQRACSLSHQLKKLGVKEQDFVCLFFENSIEYYYAYYAIVQCGAVVVPLNTFLVAHELRHIIGETSPQLFIISDALAEKIDALADHERPRVLYQKDFIVDDDTALAIPAVSSTQLAVLLYTSGTTGMPKGVMINSHNIMTNVAQILARLPSTSKDRVFGVLPFFHSFAQNGCLWSAILQGATVIIIPKIERRLLLQGLRHKPTIMMGVPALYGLLCLLKGVQFPETRYFLCGGDVLPDKIRVAFELIFGRRLSNGYGLTETCPFIALNNAEALTQANNVGSWAAGLEVMLTDEQGNKVPEGQVGILHVRGGNVMMGYFKAAASTEAVLHDGWFNTGDFARIDEYNTITIVGRHKDLIVSKGLKIYPAEVENVLLLHPGIMKVAVIGKSLERGGQMPIACIALNQSYKKADDVEAQLKQWCSQRLASYKVPQEFIILDDLPMTALGKVDKKVLSQKYGNAS